MSNVRHVHAVFAPPPAVFVFAILLVTLIVHGGRPVAAAPLFSAPFLPFDTGCDPHHVAICDLNADGRSDLVTANFSCGTVSVLLGNGDGTFGIKTDFATGSRPRSVAIGDLNTDGRLDLATANYSSNTVSVLLGNGDGAFEERTDFPTGSSPSSVAIDDLNADGRPDLAVANYSSGTVSVLLGNGDGTFGARTDFATGSDPNSVAIEDLNADGRPDLAVASYSSWSVSVLLGNGDGTFGERTPFLIGGRPSSVAIEDLNADGRPDLAVADEHSFTVAVLLGNGDGTFEERTNFPAGSRPSCVAIGDLNADCRPDLVTVNDISGTGSVLLGNGDGTFGVASFPTGRGPRSVAIGDLNADDRADVVVANAGSNTASVLLGNGDGTFGPKADFRTGSYPSSIAIGDLNADGRSDLVTANLGTRTVSVLLGNGDGTFGIETDFRTASYPYCVAIGDLNADSRPDLAAVNFELNTVSVLLGNGDGTFGAQTEFGTGSYPSSIAIGDLNADDRADVVVANAGSNTVSVLLGNGDGTFGPKADFGTGVNPYCVTIGDLNADDRADVVVANAGSSTVSVLLGDGNGTFGARTDFRTGDGPNSVATGDLNADGRPDLAATNSSYSTVSVLLGNGDGTFGPKADFGTGFWPWSVAIGDLNADGRLDLAAVNFELNTVSVLLAWDALMPPSCLTATACDASVQLAWTDNSSEEIGFAVERKPHGYPDSWYMGLPQRPANATTATDVPPSGIPYSYRVRAIGVGRSSDYSNEALADIPTWTEVGAPTTVSVKSVGDGDHVRVRIGPPEGRVWGGIHRMEVEVAEDAGFSVNVDTLQATRSDSEPLATALIAGQREEALFLRARYVDDCGRQGPWSAPASATPRYAPVLLLHGRWSHPGIWAPIWTGSLDSAPGYGPSRYLRPKFECSGHSWKEWAQELRTLVGECLRPGGVWAGDESVDIIAHSAGGLAARQYIESMPGADSVRTLVMLGTPNHGGWYSRLSGYVKRHFCRPLDCDLFLPCDWELKGDADLMTNSEALRLLNFNDRRIKDDICIDVPPELADTRRGNTEYFTFAGTGWYSCSESSDALLCRAYEVTAGQFGLCASDGLVPVPSAALRSLPPGHNFVDTDVLPTGGVSHIGLLASPPHSVGMLDSPEVRDFAFARLRREPSPVSLLTEADSNVLTQAWSVPADSLTLLVTVRDSVGGGEERQVVIAVDSVASLTVVCTWHDSLLTLRLMAPDGTVYSPADTLGNPWLRYETVDSLGYAGFAVDDPAPGTWRVAVAGAPGPEASRFHALWIAGGSPYKLTAAVSEDVLLPGETARITARLADAGGPLAVNATADVRSPSGSAAAMQLNDDGTAGDEIAGDGTYSGEYVAPTIGGPYSVNVSATWSPTGGPDVVRGRELSFFVDAVPDLEIEPDRLTWSPVLPGVGASVQLTAALHNRGYLPADSVDVRLVDQVSSGILDVVRVSVAPLDSASITLIWTPQVAGTHHLAIEATLLGMAETRPGNNRAALIVPVVGEPLLDVRNGELAPPARFELAPPRPNPSLGQVTFVFALPRAASVSIAVFDVSGRLVQRLANGVFPPGWHTRTWDSRDRRGNAAPSGVYFVRYQVPGQIFARKTVLAR